MALSQKAIRIFSAVEVLRGGQADVRHALAALFEPSLAAFNGELFDPAKLAANINDQYKLGVNRDIVTEFAPVFEERGWLKRLQGGSNTLAYLVELPPDLEMERQSGKFIEQAKDLGEEFRVFVKSISPLSQVNKSNEELVDGLIDWLMRLDALTEQEMKTASSVYRQGRKLIYEFNPPSEVPTGDEAFLSARFVKHLFDTDSPHAVFLTELAGVGLITEVVRDFYKPNSHVKTTDLVMYLDAPVMLDFLGLSGKVEQENIKGILNRLVEIGGTLRIFRASVTEAENALSAVLARPASSRQGATADALRRGEVLEPYVRRISQNADKFISASGVTIVEQTLEQFPNEHRFFGKELIEDMYSQISWVRDDAPRWHDSSITALTMRKRAGRRSADLFESKHLIVTRNPFFPIVARRLCATHSLIGPKHVGPVIHQRQLATAIWLRAGAGGQAQEIPRRYILSSCRRVLTLRKNIVQKVQQLAGDLTPEQAEQLELLMTEDRSTQVLMDRTLGASSMIDSTNLPVLLEDMKRAAIQEAHAAADAKVATAKAEAKAKTRELSEEVRSAEKKAAELETVLEDTRAKQFRVIERAVSRTNKKVRRLRISLSLVALAMALIIEFVAFFYSDSRGLWGLVIFITVAAVAVLSHFHESLERQFVTPLLQSRDERTFDLELADLGLTRDDIDPLVYYDSGKYVFK